MRAGLGILSLLICVAIGAYLWSLSAGTASQQEKPGGAVDQARQISGRGADGTNAAPILSKRMPSTTAAVISRRCS